MTAESPLRILFLTQTFPRFSDDTAGPFIRDLARGLVRRGDHVTVLAPHAKDVPSRWQIDGVEIRTFRYAPVSWEVLGYGRSLEADETIKLRAGLVTPLYLWALRRETRRLVAESSFDLVHAHWVVPNALAVAGAVRRVPLAVGLHGSDVFLAEKPLVRIWVRRTMKKVGLLTGCSPELVERVCNVGFPDDLSRVIPYGVDVEVFSPKADPETDWRDKLGIPASAPMILSVGRMATKKGYQVLVHGLGELFRRCPEAHLVLAGGGDLLEVLKEAAKPWSNQVHFPGSVLRDTLPDLFRAADIFVLPAVHDSQGNVDGLPNVILEAMASGLPVVATAISGIPLAVNEERTGLLVPEGEVDSLIDALERLVVQPELRRHLGEGARRKAETELTWDVVAGRYRAAYTEVLSGLNEPSR